MDFLHLNTVHFNDLDATSSTLFGALIETISETETSRLNPSEQCSLPTAKIARRIDTFITHELHCKTKLKQLRMSVAAHTPWDYLVEFDTPSEYIISSLTI